MISIELDLPPDQAGRVFRHKAVSAQRRGRLRTGETAITWYEAPDADGDTLLARDGENWAIQRTRRLAGWPVGVETLPSGTDEAVAPPRAIAALQGRIRSLTLATGAEDAPPLALRLLEGTLRNVTDERALCRLSVEGEPAEAARLALLLGETLPLAPTRQSVADIARTLGGADPGAPPAPEVEPDGDVDAALASLFGALSVALLTWVGVLEGEAISPRAVHQARVATRRLRSALIVFRRPLGGSLDGLKAPLKSLASSLGAARDWDVFLEGTGAEIGAALGADARIGALLAEAACAREAAHAALRRVLARPATRRLLLHLSLLASLRPWREDAAPLEGDPAEQDLAQPVRALAPALVDRRFRKLTGAGKHLDGRDPLELHEIRKTAKKLRYALEFLHPTLPRGDTRRLLKLLGALQDELGALNDIAVGAALMETIAPAGGAHDFASGCVSGWLAARAVEAQAALGDTWRAVRHTERFWRT